MLYLYSLMLRSVILTFVLPLLFSSCKRDIAGCTDIEATNLSLNANLNDGSCKYKALIMNSSFESGDGYWSTYTGSGFSPYAYATNIGDGFMPTNGQNFFKCIPQINFLNGTSTQQYLGANKHSKGLYFDYSYIAIAGADSVLNAWCGIGFVMYVSGSSLTNFTLWSKTISESPKTFGGKPIIKVQKRNEYIELPYTENNCQFGIGSLVTKGTFTFQIDNIREVPR